MSFPFHSVFGILDKSASIYGQMSNTVEPNVVSDLSPAAANDDGAEGAEGDDDDPFSKRR